MMQTWVHKSLTISRNSSDHLSHSNRIWQRGENKTTEADLVAKWHQARCRVATKKTLPRFTNYSMFSMCPLIQMKDNLSDWELWVCWYLLSLQLRLFPSTNTSPIDPLQILQPRHHEKRTDSEMKKYRCQNATGQTPLWISNSSRILPRCQLSTYDTARIYVSRRLKTNVHFLCLNEIYV